MSENKKIDKDKRILKKGLTNADWEYEQIGRKKVETPQKESKEVAKIDTGLKLYLDEGEGKTSLQRFYETAQLQQEREEAAGEVIELPTIDREIEQTEYLALSDSALDVGLVRKGTQVLWNGATNKTIAKVQNTMKEKTSGNPPIRGEQPKDESKDPFDVSTANIFDGWKLKKSVNQQSVEFASETISDSQTKTVEEVAQELEEEMDVAKEALFVREDSQKDLNAFMAKHFTQEDVRV